MARLRVEASLTVADKDGALVVGGGPAGLSAAYESCRLGIPATVLEAEQQVGGLSRTLEHEGYRFDLGGHRFFSKVPEVNEFWRELLGDDLLERSRTSRIFYRQTFFEYPLRPGNALAGLGPVEAARCVLSYLAHAARSEREAESFEDWVIHRFGRRLYEIFFKTYSEKVWGLSCKELSSDWAAQRIQNLTLWQALRGMLRTGSARAASGETITSLIEQFHYPTLGPGMMWERCEKRIADRGCPTHRGMTVERLLHRGGRVERVVARTVAGVESDFEAASFVSSMPISDLILSMDPPPPTEVLRAARSLGYRDFVTVVLMIRAEHVFEDNWLYIHEPGFEVCRIQNYKNWSPAMVPDATRTSLGLEYFLGASDVEWSRSDDEWIALGYRECEALGFVEPAQIEDAIVVRVQKAYPIHDRATASHLATIRTWLSRFENLQTVGRNGQHRYNNQDHSILTGLYAARNLAGESFDPWSVNLEQEYLEDR